MVPGYGTSALALLRRRSAGTQLHKGGAETASGPTCLEPSNPAARGGNGRLALGTSSTRCESHPGGPSVFGGGAGAAGPERRGHSGCAEDRPRCRWNTQCRLCLGAVSFRGAFSGGTFSPPVSRSGGESV